MANTTETVIYRIGSAPEDYFKNNFSELNDSYFQITLYDTLGPQATLLSEEPKTIGARLCLLQQAPASTKQGILLFPKKENNDLIEIIRHIETVDRVFEKEVRPLAKIFYGESPPDAELKPDKGAIKSYLISSFHKNFKIPVLDFEELLPPGFEYENALSRCDLYKLQNNIKCEYVAWLNSFK